MAAQGLFHVAKLVAAIEGADSTILEPARPILSLLVEQLRSLDERVAVLDREIARRAKEDAEAKRLMTIPGIGPITATALAALAPSASIFKKGGTSQLGWGSPRYNVPPAASRSLARHLGWASEPCVGC